MVGRRITEGKKYDKGKLRYDLLPFDSLEEIVKVYTYGACKYEDNNWLKGMKWGRIAGAMLRHYSAFIQGKEIDSESGLPHLAHMAWNAIALLTYWKRGIGEDNIRICKKDNIKEE